MKSYADVLRLARKNRFTFPENSEKCELIAGMIKKAKRMVLRNGEAHATKNSDTMYEILNESIKSK
jgi:ribosomal protein L30/L7E